MKKVAIVLALMLMVVLTQCALAQELGHYYTPYGLSYPNLQKGEYSLSLSGNYSDAKSNYDNFDSTLYSKYSNYYSSYYFRGIFAITSKILFQTSVDYYPSRYTYNYLSVYGPDDVYGNSQKRNASLQPSFSLAYKPTTTLEIYGNVAFYTSSYKYKYYPFDPPSGSDTDKYTSKNRSIGFGINYIGKL
jgi:hypothetical protein